MLSSSIAIVIGPVPPGHRRQKACNLLDDASMSPRIPSSVLVRPTSRQAAPGLTISAVTMPGPPDGGDDDVGAAHVGGEVGGT